MLLEQWSMMERVGPMHFQGQEKSRQVYICGMEYCKLHIENAKTVAAKLAFGGF